MTGLEIWLIALSLSMDCLAVSIASGLILKRICWRPMAQMAFLFGLFQMTMTLIGWIFASHFSHMIEGVDHWIAFCLLVFIGGRMIIESFKKEDKRIFDPTKLKIVFTLAIATSIDAMAVGISFAFLGLKAGNGNILSASFVIGLVSFVISWTGLLIGIFFGNSFARKLRAEMWGGIILIGIGVKILIEHLFCN
jgi:putative Mn2+ efflux pump MntP